MVDTTSIITLGVGLIAAIGVFIGIRMSHFSHNIQDLRGDVTQWYESIYKLEYIPKFQENPIDPYKIMNVALKYASIKNIHNTLHFIEDENTLGVRVEGISMAAIGIMIALSILSDTMHFSIPNIIAEGYITYLIPTVGIISVFGIVIYRLIQFWSSYSSIRKMIKDKNEQIL